MRATSAGAGTVPGPLNTARHAASSRWRGAGRGAGATSVWMRLLVRLTTDPPPALPLASRRLFAATAVLLPSTFIKRSPSPTTQNSPEKLPKRLAADQILRREKKRKRAKSVAPTEPRNRAQGGCQIRSRGDRYTRAVYTYAHTVPRAKNHGLPLPWSWGDEIPVDSLYFSRLSDSTRTTKPLASRKHKQLCVLDQRPGCACSAWS